MRRYEVIKDIPDGWETTAKVGDILTVERWEGENALFKGKKAICDEDSPYANEHCRLITVPQAINSTESPSHGVTAAESEVYGNDCPNGSCS